jgi:hypothetical protein
MGRRKQASSRKIGNGANLSLHVSGAISMSFLRLLYRLIAALVGLVLMVMGMGMDATIVFMPIGLPLALFGLLLFAWGLSPTALHRRT